MLDLEPAAIDLGGKNVLSGVSTSRTLMLTELRDLFASIPPDSSLEEYREAIVTRNVLLKRSLDARLRTFPFLRDRYGLDLGIPAFAMLRKFWDLDPDGQPLMALLVAALRDPLMRIVAQQVLTTPPGTQVRSGDFHSRVAGNSLKSLSQSTLESTCKNLISTFTQSGHLGGKSVRLRRYVHATPGSITIALLLASFENRGGRRLFESDWVKLLDTPTDLAIAEARIAAQRGWLELRHGGDILEIGFERLLAAIGWSE